MRKMEKDFRTWSAIVINFSDEILKCAAATKAYKKVEAENPDCSKNKYLSLAANAIWEELLLDITKLFDRARTFGNENCSIEMLKELSQNSSRLNAAQKEKLLKQADALYAEYQELMPTEVRNKHLAHADLQTILTYQRINISYESIEPFILRVLEFLSDISVPFFKYQYELVFHSLDEIATEYEKVLQSFLESTQTHKEEE